MQNSIQIKIPAADPSISEILVARLSETGFDGFEEEEAFLLAYCNEPAFDEAALTALLSEYGLAFEKTVIKAQNWNEVWESNFHPVVVDSLVAVRAEFHKPIPGVQYEIVITPKMSFGTGHHATTWMMMQQLGKLDIIGKTVFDFGTGTGILAILAQKLGASSVTAIDNDEWCILNAAENIDRNNCRNIRLLQADSPLLGGEKFDVILANINKNIIRQNLSLLANMLNEGGFLLLSGLLAEDEAGILLKTGEISLKFCFTTTRDKWICMLFNQK